MTVSLLSNDCIMTVSWLSHDCLMSQTELLGFGGPWVSAVSAFFFLFFFYKLSILVLNLLWSPANAWLKWIGKCGDFRLFSCTYNYWSTPHKIRKLFFIGCMVIWTTWGATRTGQNPTIWDSSVYMPINNRPGVARGVL